MSSTLKIGIVNIRYKENWLCIKIHEWLEDSDVCPLVGGKERHLDVGNWKKKRLSKSVSHTYMQYSLTFLWGLFKASCQLKQSCAIQVPPHHRHQDTVSLSIKHSKIAAHLVCRTSISIALLRVLLLGHMAVFCVWDSILNVKARVLLGP